VTTVQSRSIKSISTSDVGCGFQLCHIEESFDVVFYSLMGFLTVATVENSMS